MIKTILQGLAIGVANIIPGISGGTLAVVLGIYDRLIDAIDSLTTGENRLQNIGFLGQIGVGAVLGIFLFARGLKYCLSHYPEPTYLLFVGLIIGSIPIIFRSHSDMRLSAANIVLFIAGLGILAALFFVDNGSNVNPTGLPPATPGTLAFLFGSAVIAAGSMVIPGISGSLLLVILGAYSTIISAISDFSIPHLGAVGVGTLIGIWLFTKVIHFCLHHWPGPTYFFIIGLLCGSILHIFPPLTFTVQTALGALFLASGVTIALKLQ